MKRQEEIKKAAEAINIKIISNPWTFFEKGAEWADTHPHWISVEDRKPKLKHSSDNIKYSETVIVTNGKYYTSARWLHYTLGCWYGWYDAADEELKGITHWMPMPEPPIKKGGEK